MVTIPSIGDKRLKHEGRNIFAVQRRDLAALTIDAATRSSRIIFDLAHLLAELERKMSNFLGRQALVIGAGMSGLAAAGALANHFKQVTVLERDGLAHDPSHRPGTPQSRQLHGLLSGGLEALCQIFPGFDQDLAAAGAVPIRVAADIHEELPGFDPFPRRDFGAIVYTMSRPLLEYTVRRRARAHRNVVIRDHCRVLDLVSSADGRSITGARCEGIDGTRETVRADLVVDASARGTLTLAALEAMGRARPLETTVGVNIGYATAAFEMPQRRPDWKAVLTFAGAPSDGRCGYLLPVEGNRWMACITEQQCPRPPVDLNEFLGAARRLRTRTIYDAIKNAEPAGTPQRFGFPESSWRHYETVADFPQGLIPIGDAVCQFNPDLRPRDEHGGTGGEHTGPLTSAARRQCRRLGRIATRVAGRSSTMDRRGLVHVGDPGPGIPADPRRTPD